MTNQHIFPCCTLTDMTGLMTYPYTTSHISLKSKVFSSFLTTWCDPQRSVSPWSAWRPEASAPRTRKSRPCWACRNRQRSGGCREAGTWRATSDDRVVRRLVCESCPCCMFLLTSLGVSCVPLVCWSMAVMRSAFVPQRSSTPGFLLSHVAQSLVSANVCRRLAPSAAQEYMKAEHWPVKQVICG